ncbi:MAG: AAA family ATPase [Chloroflexota bacterium]|jgi:hypothetical protein
MLTFGDALNQLGETLFVGRERELSVFREWLRDDSQPPVILNISGHGGIGKTMLLRSFVGIARNLGWPVLSVDCNDFPHTPDGFLRALSGYPEKKQLLGASLTTLDAAAQTRFETDGEKGDALVYLNEIRPVLFLDTFEALGELQRFFVEQVLPKLPAAVKIVIAGRHPLGNIWMEDASLCRIVHPIPLDGFNTDESREYLHRRGLRDKETVEQVLAATGGNPLALSLAADMVLQLGIKHLTKAPRWHLIVRSLVERLLRDAKDPELRDLLEAAAVVRQFDEATLAAVSGRKDISSAFGRLCHLSVVRPAQHGLLLHDDFRRYVADDLRWRHPDRYREMRLRALAYYKERMRVASPIEREWLVAERLFLWENALIQSTMYGEGEPGEFWIEEARPDDYPEIRRIHDWWIKNVMDKDVEYEGDIPEHNIFLEAILEYPKTRLRVVRGQDGSVLGFSSTLPVCKETIPILNLNPIFAPILYSYWSPSELEALPAKAEDSDIWYPLHIAEGDRQSEQVRAALLRDHMGLYMMGGLYIVSAPHPLIKKLLNAWGFRLIPDARTWGWGSKHPVDCYVLDLRQIGVERWIESIMAGKRPCIGLSPRGLERELHSVLLNWHNDILLARSPLADILLPQQVELGAERSAALRQTIVAAMATAMAVATPQQERAYRALELAYIQRTPNHDAAAERLAVSRATFYRLLKRGIRWLAEELSRA